MTDLQPLKRRCIGDLAAALPRYRQRLDDIDTRLFGMPADTYTKYRLPYEHEQQVKQQPKFKFRKI